MSLIPYISVVIPVFNEAEGIADTIARIFNALEELNRRVELIVVDDGSTDDTASKVEQLVASDPRIKLISFSRSFGYQNAIAAGLRESSGENVAIVDGDLQDPPELVPEMLHVLDEGSDVVYGVRDNHKETLIKRAAYKGYYYLLSLLSERSVPRNAGDFCVMRRHVVDELNGMPERSPYIRGLRNWVGFKQTPYHYDRLLRRYGADKHRWKTLFKLASIGVVSSSRAPLTLAIYIGIALALAGFAWTFKVIFVRIMYDTAPEGFSALMVAILVIGGVQLIATGVIGMYLARVLDQTEARPNYIVARHIDRDGNHDTDTGP